ncbi:type II secretion system F family protein [Deinococcus multiflagellatus]|uniref:Type II secretion system F family protein n=1 Tax=Deinococcus multiflagellatus TaxID=1656887 RepID=A0ABW1ZUW6_9DEIO|nr:type II secretion system F family protein [Deinococcus multiflagellatus]MBZ9714407.1 type II secretion system F family protein [Deinococcus multiflagellatus]
MINPPRKPRANVKVRTFRYQGVHRRTGKPRKGMIEAIDQPQALEQLQSRNISVTTIKEHKDVVLLERKPSDNQLGLFFKEISTLLTAETPMPDAVRSAGRSTTNAKLKRSALSMERDLREEGQDLAAAMSQQPLFAEVTVALLETARVTGRDIEVLATLASSHFWRAKIAGDVRKAINKPIFTLALTLIVMYLLSTKVVPQFVTLIENMNVAVPLVTQIVMGMSRVMTSPFFVIIVAAVGIGVPLLYRVLTRSPEGEATRDALLLRLPLVGPLIRNYILALTSRSLADMISSGVPKDMAMELTGRIAGNKLYDAIFQNAARAVVQGHPIADILEDYPALVPTDFAQIVRNGEEKSSLDTMLITLSEIYEKRVDETVQKVNDSIEPILIVVIGSLVGLVMFGVMMPIITIIQSLNT